MRMPRFRHASSDDGFTIVEFAVALVIFVIGILGVSGLLLTVIHANRSASNRTRADQLLYEKVEQFQSTPFAAIEGGADQTSVGDVVFTRTWTVANDVPVENVATIEIAAEWSERDETFSVQTATMRSRD